MVSVAESRREEILRWLEEVKDPEVPVLSVRELGVLRDVEVTDDEVVVVMTPTYSGCPAMHAMEAEVLATLNVLALAACAFLYWKGRHYPSSPDAVYTGRFLFDFFQGVELHPRLFGTNLKQLLNCRVSMMGWSALFLVFALAHLSFGRGSGTRR